MPAPADLPLFARLRGLAANGPLVVAHRGDSAHHPENTLPAFRAATALGAPVQEFDVQVCGDGQLVCCHDATLDRTTDAPTVLGPGALLAQLPLHVLRRLDAGAWKGPAHARALVPTLAEALGCMLPQAVPMIEHKAGGAAAFVAELRRLGVAAQVLLQSFDWDFVRAAARLEPQLPLGVLGPTASFDAFDERALHAARDAGAGFVHWEARAITRPVVQRAHELGLLVCTYTSDDELAWRGGAACGIDMMCTNDPGRMLAMAR